MSAQNLATIKTLLEDWGRRDYARAFEIYDEEVTWDSRPLRVPELAHVFRGHDGVRAFWREWLAAWERVEMVDGPYYEAHGNQVLSWWMLHLVGRESGLAFDKEAGHLWTFQNGRIVYVAVFFSHEELFRAAGLERPHGS